MFIVDVDFSKNNLAIEQMNVLSFYELPFFNENFFKYRLKSITGLPVEKMFLVDFSSKKIDINHIFPVECIEKEGLLRFVLETNDDETVLILKNNVYVEFDLSDIINDFSLNKEKDSLLLCDSQKEIFAMLLNASVLKKELYRYEHVKDFFIKQEKKCSDKAIIDGYIKIIETVKDYKNLVFDLLNSKTMLRLPFVAEGIYTDGKVPEGDYIINPPVFLENGVQIENGSVIGPDTVVLKDSLISNNTSVKNTIIFPDVYVSSDCYIDGAICCNSVAIKRNSAVFPGAVIGKNSIIGEDTVVEKGAVIRKNVKADHYLKSPFTHSCNEDFIDCLHGLTPDEAALLGAAIGVVLGKPKISVASDGEPNSLAVKLALLSGFVASGCDCIDFGNTYNTRIFYCTSFCEFQYSVFVVGKGGGTDIKIYDSQAKPISKSVYYNLISVINSKEITYCKPEEGKNIRQIKGLCKTYIRDLTTIFSSPLELNVRIICKNIYIKKTFEEALKKIGTLKNTSEDITFVVNYEGSVLKCLYKDQSITNSVLKRIVSFEKRKEALADNGGFINNLWKYDAVFLAFNVLNILSQNNGNIVDIIKEIPQFYVLKKTVVTPIKQGELAKKITNLQNYKYNEEGFDLFFEKGKISFKNKENNSRIKILTCAKNAEFAYELSDFAVSFLMND